MRRRWGVAAPLLAMHITSDVVLVKLGPIVLFAYPYLGLYGCYRHDPQRGFSEYQHVLFEHRHDGSFKLSLLA